MDDRVKKYVPSQLRAHAMVEVVGSDMDCYVRIANYRKLECDLAEATADLKRITDMLSDSATVHANIMRGTIKISKANLIHAAGLPANIEEQLAEAQKAAGWTPITPENLPKKGNVICYPSGHTQISELDWEAAHFSVGWFINPPAQEPKEDVHFTGFFGNLMVFSDSPLLAKKTPAEAEPAQEPKP